MTKDCWGDVFHWWQSNSQNDWDPRATFYSVTASRALVKWVGLAYIAQIKSSHNCTVFQVALCNLGGRCWSLCLRTSAPCIGAGCLCLPLRKRSLGGEFSIHVVGLCLISWLEDLMSSVVPWFKLNPDGGGFMGLLQPRWISAPCKT